MNDRKILINGHLYLLEGLGKWSWIEGNWATGTKFIKFYNIQHDRTEVYYLRGNIFIFMDTEEDFFGHYEFYTRYKESC